MPSSKHHLFQVNQHAQASIMLLSVMEGAEVNLNNTVLSSSSKAATTSSSMSASDDYEKGLSKGKNNSKRIDFLWFLDLQLAAELGRYLLERNQELQNYVDDLQKQIDDEQCNVKVRSLK